MLDVQSIRKDFPILDHKIYDKPLIYFDNGATTQKPRPVVEKIESGYYNVNANIHRGVHFLSQAATEAHEDARKTVQQFLNARSANEIVFTRGTTEAINLIASSFTDECMSAGDEVIVSVMEHHSNIVPWQIQAARKGITLKVIPMNEKGELCMDTFRKTSLQSYHRWTYRTSDSSYGQDVPELGFRGNSSCSIRQLAEVLCVGP